MVAFNDNVLLHYVEVMWNLTCHNDEATIFLTGHSIHTESDTCAMSLKAIISEYRPRFHEQLTVLLTVHSRQFLDRIVQMDKSTIH